jgi:hypothetical protein
LQTTTYDHIPFGKVDEEMITGNMKKFSTELKHFGERKRCVSCGMKHMDIRKKEYREQTPDYWRFVRVSDECFTEDHLGVYTTVMEPCLENCILHLAALDFEHGLMDICEPCDTHFVSKKSTFPSWILANNLTLLPLPEYLEDIRDTEIQLVTTRLRTHNIATITSSGVDKNTFLRSHVYCYGANPTLAIATLPFDMLSNKAFNVSIVGSYTSDVKALVSTAYEIRPKKSLQLLTLCQERKNAAILERTNQSLMADIMELAASKCHFLIIIRV